VDLVGDAPDPSQCSVISSSGSPSFIFSYNNTRARVVDVSILVPVLNPNIEFDWEQNIKSNINYEILLCDEDGVSQARNAGIRRAEAEKLVFLDDDSYPRSGYFDRCSRLLDDHSAITGRVVDTGCKHTRPFVNHYDQGDEMHTTDRLVGCNMCFRREVFDTVGTFDERLPYGHEEREFADRVTREFGLLYDPALIIEHPFADSVVGYWRKSYRHGREEITYWDITDENVGQNVLSDIVNPYGYLRPSIKDSLVRSGAEVSKNFGQLRGYAEYLLEEALEE